MLVRDKTLPRSDYKGRITAALDKSCPCRICYNPHDCGRYAHRNGKTVWVTDMRCLTRDQHGCPNITLTDRQPRHIYKPRGKKCLRCGVFKP